jgi:NAD/NADP transhydrogenase beta subunit
LHSARESQKKKIAILSRNHRFFRFWLFFFTVSVLLFGVWTVVVIISLLRPPHVVASLQSFSGKLAAAKAYTMLPIFW